jgi:hypothetical protein
MADIKCIECGLLMEDVHFNKRICETCKWEKGIEYCKNWYRKNKSVEPYELVRELKRVFRLGGKYLTRKGFDEESKYTSMSIIKELKKSWFELLVVYEMVGNLFTYVCEEYLKHAYKHNIANSSLFIKSHQYIGQYLFATIIEIKEVRKQCGFINEHYDGQYNDYLLKRNFQKIMEKLGKIPSVTEFLKHSPIRASIYCDYYGISGQRWEEVLKVLIKDKVVLESYFKERKEELAEKSIKSLVDYQQENLISDEELEREFRRVFDYYFQNLGTYPTRRLFNKMTVYSDNTYLKRYKIRWSELVKKYGYVQEERNISEKVCLEIIKKITGHTYERNKTWNWLKGIYGKHLFCDGYFKGLNLVVEFDGKHHRVPVPNFGGEERFQKDKLNDSLKEELVQKKGIKFLRISSKENWEDINYLKGKLNNFLQ